MILVMVPVLYFTYKRIDPDVPKALQFVCDLMEDGKIPTELFLTHKWHFDDVAKAYAELEKAGAVYNLPKKGVYVAEIDIQSSRQQQIRSVLQPLKDSGITKEEIILAAEKIFEETSYVKD